jgi:hypothetical protein
MVEALGPEVSAQQRTQLQDLLIACVAGGASIGFLAPLSREDAAAYWRKIEAELPAGQRVLMVVRTEGGESQRTASCRSAEGDGASDPSASRARGGVDGRG